MPAPSLLEFARRFQAARPNRAARTASTAELPAELVALVTDAEPHRAQALEDLRLLVAIPKHDDRPPVLELIPPVEIQPFERWPESVHRFGVRLSFPTEPASSAIDLLERIAVENGEWRIVQVWDEVNRGQTQRFLSVVYPR